jgi:uncharacterized lipoprotein YddW (UPF0748 family)
VSLSKGDFGREDQPAGWAQVDGVRICAWKSGDTDTFCAVDNLHARSEDVCLVRGTPEGSEARTAKDVTERIAGYLKSAGVSFNMIADEDVATGGLTGSKVAIFGYNPGMSDEVAASVEEFIAGGGKAIVFYSIHATLAEAIGLTDMGYKQREHDGQFAEVVFEPDALPGLPERINQGSWNIQTVVPGGHNARVIGTWQDSGDAAVIVSDNGAYMGHILTERDADNKQVFMLAMLGHFVPSTWEVAATHALDGEMRVGGFTDRAELEAWLAERLPGATFEGEVTASLAAARQAEAQARALLEDKQYAEVLAVAATMGEALTAAYIVAHAPRDGEFRAVWNHSGTGDCGSWDEAMARLSAAGFNAVVPNMWWGGVAHYDSDLLPHSKTFDERGDQIAQAVAAGKKYGIEVHPWKVNWNLSTAPDEFVERMRREGRLQADHTGAELKWLCPSHPDNFRLEVDTMVEVARKYDVDGVHFDYIRYPHGNSCYCGGCRERFEAAAGVTVENWPEDCYSGKLRDQYRQWRCDNITAVVRATAEEVRRIKPHVKISAAVFGSYPATRDSIGQDWVLWCREGWLDFVCPMDYTRSDSYFRQLVTSQVGYVGGTVPLYTGIGEWRIPHDQAIGQVEISRGLGADGFILFNMGAALAETGLPKFGQGITSAAAVLPHNAPLVRFTTDLDSEEPVVECDGDALTVEVAMVSLGAHRRQVIGMTGTIELQDLDGNALAELGDLPEVGESVAVEIAKREGVFRLAAVGELTFEGGATERFIRRSRPYRFAAE